MEPTERMLIEGSVHELGDGFSVRRLLPHAQRRMVGPFVFFDHMGPTSFAPGTGVDVRPHPHIGLATVTYLFEGELRHRDSLGRVQDIRPGELNWMTAGRGIVHSERTPPQLHAKGQRLHGIQTWVALPEAHAECAPTFEHHSRERLPFWEHNGVSLRLIAGSAYGRRAPQTLYSSLFDLACTAQPGSSLILPEEYAERAVYMLEGEAEFEGVSLHAGQMLVECGGAPGRLRARSAITAMVFGGAPFGKPPHVWWNFVARERARIERAKADWREGRFAPVPGEHEFIPLPER